MILRDAQQRRLAYFKSHVLLLHEEPALSPLGNGTWHGKSSKPTLMPCLTFQLRGFQSTFQSLGWEHIVLQPRACQKGQLPW